MKQFFTLRILTESDTTLQSVAPVNDREWKAMLMRKIAYVVLCSYTLLLLNPAMPVFADVIAHTFWEQEHLMTVHEVNGKFHIHYEVNKASHSTDKDKSANMGKSEVNEYLHVARLVFHVPETGNSIEQAYSRYTSHYHFSTSDIETPPPDRLF